MFISCDISWVKFFVKIHENGYQDSRVRLMEFFTLFILRISIEQVVIESQMSLQRFFRKLHTFARAEQFI